MNNSVIPPFIKHFDIIHDHGGYLSLPTANLSKTPVVAFKLGSIPEVIEDRKSGFVVEDVAGMIEAVANIAENMF